MALLSLRKTWKNGSRVLPLNSRWGLHAPDPRNPSSEKMTSQPTFFCCTYFPKSVIKLHQFLIRLIQTHILTCFWKIKACMGVKYFSVRVRKHASHLPINICTTVGKKTQSYVVKCDLLSETTFLPYFMTAWCVFFSQSVYFLQWCSSCFSSREYFSVIFVIQCW